MGKSQGDTPLRVMTKSRVRVTPVAFPGEQGLSPRMDKWETRSGEWEAWGPATSLSGPQSPHLQTGMPLPALWPPLRRGRKGLWRHRVLLTQEDRGAAGRGPRPAPSSCTQAGGESAGTHAQGAHLDNLHGDTTSSILRTRARRIPGTRQPAKVWCWCWWNPAALPSS